jgi:thiosulfate/3-mercaptopyruvate sulfurtransferase
VAFHETVAESGHFTPRTAESIICRLDDVMSKVGEGGVQILNVLPETFYQGIENPFGNKLVGAYSGLTQRPIEKFLTDEDRHVFKPVAEHQAILTEAGLSPTNESIIHCQAGVRTTVGFFVLSLLGWDRVRAYDASLAEWANRDDTALVVD